MKLEEIQRRMCEAVMTPLTRSETSQPRTNRGKSMRKLANEIIKPNDRLTSFERLEIYNRQYWFRILSAFSEDFVGLRALVGERRFDRLAQAYLNENPSTSFTLRNLGSKLESWLRAHPRWAHPRQALAVDMVRLEWADIEAFDGAQEPPLTPADLEGMGEDSTFRLQPYIQLLDLHFPIDDLLLSIRKGEDYYDKASNAFVRRKKSSRLKFGSIKREPVYLAVHRIDFSVYFKRIDREGFLLLGALRDGKRLSEAVELAFRGSSIREAECVELIQRWFQDWARWGWFCRPTSKENG
ncbi:MAG TPA: DNA-binding domain-containing protein [Terriglobales bacterium]|nr:DNA-binding domain-containing protein [Terriglobales bacterium]